MNSSNLVKVIFALTFFASTASATTTYNFSSGGVWLNFDSPTAGKDFTFTVNDVGTTRTIIYDEVTKKATVNITGNATVNGLTSAFNLVMDFLNVIPITNPAGIIGFSGVGATADGRLNIANVGDVTGDGNNDNISLDLFAKFMNFSGSTQAPYNEVANLGLANFFLWQSISQGSILAKAWYGTDNIFVNGQNRNGLFNSVSGDMHLAGGSANTQVPEPATALLLGLGTLGGILRRRKNA